MRNKPGINVTFLCLTMQAYTVLENRQKRYFRRHKIGKKTYTIFVKMRHQRLILTRPYIDKRRVLRNKKKP